MEPIICGLYSRSRIFNRISCVSLLHQRCINTGSSSYRTSQIRLLNLHFEDKVLKTLLWCKRLGHLNFDALHELSKSEVLAGLPCLTKVNKICKICQLGKQSKKKNSKSICTSPSHSQLSATYVVHLKLPYILLSNRAKYFVTFIDDYSHKT